MTAENDPYSNQYQRITQEGHRRPTSHIGAPALVWHIGIWPKKDIDPQNARVERDKDWEPRRNSGELDKKSYKEAVTKFNTRRTQIAEEVSALIQGLQQRGRSVEADQFEGLEVYTPEELLNGRKPDDPPPAVIYNRDSIGFTLWWADGDGPQAGCPSNPDASFLRVRTQVEAYLDFITITFYIDVGKPYDHWNMPTVGVRRNAILQNCSSVTGFCDQHVGTSGRHHLPETGVAATDAAALLEAGNFLYEGIWTEFQRSFDFDLKKLAGKSNEVFANFRGLVLSTAGGQQSVTMHESRFDEKGTEQNDVLRAYWPFVRRFVPAADYRQFTASSLIGGRAIYLSALGAPSELDYSDETSEIPGKPKWFSQDIPADHLPEPPGRGSTDPQPIRYLFLVRNTPDLRQLGRIIERINAAGSMRLFALRDLVLLREASTHLRIRGQELDNIMEDWTAAHERAKRTYENRKFDLDQNDRYYKRISEISSGTEQRLIAISTELDRISQQSIGGLPFRVMRSKHYIKMFDSQIDGLRVKRIETWVPYDEFVARGLRPTFEFIEAVGVRLDKLRGRLQNAMQAVQTSAIVAQTEATRQVSSDLKKVASGNDRLAIAGILVAGASLASQTKLDENPTFKSWSASVHDNLISPVVTVAPQTTALFLGVAISFVFVFLIVNLIKWVLGLREVIQRMTWIGLGYHIVGLSLLTVGAMLLFVPGVASVMKLVSQYIEPGMALIAGLVVMTLAVGTAAWGVWSFGKFKWFRRPVDEL